MCATDESFREHYRRVDSIVGYGIIDRDKLGERVSSLVTCWSRLRIFGDRFHAEGLSTSVVTVALHLTVGGPQGCFVHGSKVTAIAVDW